MTKYQQYYWKDPDHCRELQRAKYQRYPDKIKSMNKKWQIENADYFKELVNFASKLRYERTHKNRPEKIASIIAMRDEFKSRHKTH